MRKSEETYPAVLPMVRNTLIPYEDARPRIQQADILLWLFSGGEFGRMIRRRAPPNAPYVHAGMAILSGYEGGPIHSCDIQLAQGGQRRRLSADAANYSGKIEVWRMPKLFHFEANAVAAEMEAIIDRPYGWKTCIAYAMRVSRWWPFHWPLPDERTNGHVKPVCSQAVAMACRKGADRDPLPPGEPMTTPWHFAQNHFAEYQFTLV